MLAPAPLTETTELRELWQQEATLSRSARIDIVRAALRMLEGSYVHLVQKRARYAVDPLQRLRLLLQELEDSAEDELGSDLGFHCQMIELFTSLRDLHTNYLLPSPYREMTACLPFLVEEVTEGAQRSYLVSKVLASHRTRSFEAGAIIVDWNGVPIERALALLADRQAGANASARHACALHALTIRPLIRALPPDEHWVVVGYRNQRGAREQIRLPWQVMRHGASELADPAGVALATGNDLQASQIQQARKRLFASEAIEAERLARRDRRPRAAAAADRHRSATVVPVPTMMPTVLRAQRLLGDGPPVGYLRIFTFDVPDADELVSEVARLVALLPRAGLILDVRGNGGGLIWAAERLLQIFTPRHIEPERFQFVSSPLTLALSRRFDDFQPWRDSLALAITTGAMHSNSFPVTSEASCNAIGQRSFAPVVLITDAICFSATDIFAAGFRDHDIGPILGASGNTGAGGANVWTYSQLRELSNLARDRDADPLPALPAGIEMRVAVRRSLRVGRNAGIPVEDLGIVPDHRHAMTRRDVLEGNVDLLTKARALLRQGPHRWLSVEEPRRTRRRLQLTLHAHGISWLEVLVAERQQRALALPSATTRLSLRLPTDAECAIELRGYADDDSLVARVRLAA